MIIFHKNNSNSFLDQQAKTKLHKTFTWDTGTGPVSHYHREIILWRTLKAEILTFFQIQLYNKQKANVPNRTALLKWDDTDGPSIGNLNTYNKRLIPNVKLNAAKTIVNMLLLKYLRPMPKLSPNNPVVKRKTNSSLGWSIANKNADTK
jgi:hypothetical protein